MRWRSSRSAWPKDKCVYARAANATHRARILGYDSSVQGLSVLSGSVGAFNALCLSEPTVQAVGRGRLKASRTCGWRRRALPGHVDSGSRSAREQNARCIRSITKSAE